MNIKIKLGKRIRELRILKKITQERMAEAIEISPENYSRIENGFSYPKPENLEKICKVLGTCPKEIFNFEHHKTLSDIEKELLQIIQTDEKTTRLLYKFVKTLKN